MDQVTNNNNNNNNNNNMVTMSLHGGQAKSGHVDANVKVTVEIEKRGRL